MSNKPSWKSRELVEPYVEKQGSNRKLHTIRKQGPAREAPNLSLGFKTKNGFEYGQTKNLKLWIQAQKTGAPTDQTSNHTIRVARGTESGQLLTNKNDTPFVRFTPKPYRSTSRCLVLNTGSLDKQFFHVTSSQYVSLASGAGGTVNKAMTWNVWLKPSLTGSVENQFPSGTNRFIFSKRSGSWGASNREYDLAITTSGSLRFRLFDESTGKKVVKNTDLTISGSAIQAGTWQNICVTYSGKTGSYTHQGIKVYRNGILVSSGNAGTTESGYVATENKHGDFVIGTVYTGSNFVSGTNFFRGKIAEPAIWHVALSEKEVNAIYDARNFFGKMDTSAIDHLRQGVSILNNKQRWRSSNAPKINGISRLRTDDVISHEQDQTLYGNSKLFRDDTPFEELADAERLRKTISRTIVGSKASASIEFRGYQPLASGTNAANGLILTGANGTKSVYYFEKGGQLGGATRGKFIASNFFAVVVSGSALDLATGSIGQGELWAKAFASRVNGQTSAAQITARRVGNTVKLTSTVTGTAGNTYIEGVLLNTSNTNSSGSQKLFENKKDDASIYPSVFGFITGTYNTASVGKIPGLNGVLTFIGGNATMKHVVTSAHGGAIGYLEDAGLQQYPVIITNVSMRDPSQFDGNIEPLPIRNKVSWGSPEAPFLARDVRASFMGGEGSVLYGSSIISQQYDNKISANSSNHTVGSQAQGANSYSSETDPFIDAQENIFALPAKPAYAYLRFGKVPHNRDKIILTDTSGKSVAFEFANSTTFSTGTFGKLRNKPSSLGTGRGTWRVLLTGSDAVSLTTGSGTKTQVARAMHLFRQELAQAYAIGRLDISGSDRAYKESNKDPIQELLRESPPDPLIARAVVTYPVSSSGGTYVRLDQKASGSDGNRRIEFYARGFSSGTYIVNNVTASQAYEKAKTLFSGTLTFRNLFTRIKFVRQRAAKMGIAFISGSDSFNLPIDGYISEIERKAPPFNDTLKLKLKNPPISQKKAKIRGLFQSSTGLDSADGIILTDTEGNQYSASIDNTIARADSTARKIGYSDVTTPTRLAESVFNSLSQAITYGVSSTTKNSASGNKLKISVSRSGKTLFLTQSNPGAIGNSGITRNGIAMTLYDDHNNAAANVVDNFVDGALEIAGPDSLLTSTLGGNREWNQLGHGYKSAGAGFTYDNDMFGTDSIVYGGRKR